MQSLVVSTGTLELAANMFPAPGPETLDRINVVAPLKKGVSIYTGSQ